MSDKQKHILVIRLGALGDLIFCFQAFAAIRTTHHDAQIALLVREPFADFARAMPWFDDIIIDTHPGPIQWRKWATLIAEIKAFAPDRVYDLQGKTRQNILYKLLGGPRKGPEWSGAAPLCAFPRLWPPTPGMHFTEFLAAQLKVAGITSMPLPDLSWLDTPIYNFKLPREFIVLVPGCSPGGDYKRWPPQKYAEVAKALHSRGWPCVVVGVKSDLKTVMAIKKEAPNIINLCDRTSLYELAGIMRRASGVIGNDTGPVHMAGAVGTPTLALFSRSSSPAWSTPPGRRVKVLQNDMIANLSIGEVLSAFDTLLKHAEGAG